jgi:hypothetical protein
VRWKILSETGESDVDVGVDALDEVVVGQEEGSRPCCDVASFLCLLSDITFPIRPPITPALEARMSP